MQIKSVESFVTLYREGNIARASAKLYISQQGLSRQIQAMEQELDAAFLVTPLDQRQLDCTTLIEGEMMSYFCKLTGIRLKVLISSSNNLNFINSMTQKIDVAPVTQTMAARITNPEVVLRRVLIPERASLYYCTPREGPKCREFLEVQRYVEHYFKTTPTNQLLRPNRPAVGEARQLQA